jgi:hypothetical protein
MSRKKELIEIIKVLRKEIEVLTSRTRDRGTGHLHTAIGVINSRIDEMMDEAMQDNSEDVYDGYEEHTEAMEQARLRAIQDSAAGKPNKVRDAYLYSSTIKDDVEFNGPFGMDEKKYTHTKEYYDRGRNRPMEGEDLPITDPFTEGLSNRSMKQKYGHAVQTTSEMMQDELEPLPINTFE